MFVTVCRRRGSGGGPKFYPYNRWGICANSFDKQPKVTTKPDFDGKIPS